MSLVLLLARLLLAAVLLVAGFVVGFGWRAPGQGFLGWLVALPIPQRIEVLAGVVVLTLLVAGGWLLVQVMAQQGRLLLRLEALEARLAEAGVAAVPQAAAG